MSHFKVKIIKLKITYTFFSFDISYAKNCIQNSTFKDLQAG